MAFSGQIFAGSADLGSAASWLSALPDDEVSNTAAGQAWRNVQWALKQLPYEKSADLWAKVGSEPWMGFEQFMEFSSFSSNNYVAHGGLDGFLDALGKTWPEDKITAQFERWSMSDPGEAMEWLDEAPSTPVTKGAIRGLVKTLEQTDPETAASWSAKLAE